MKFGKSIGNFIGKNKIYMKYRKFIFEKYEFNKIKGEFLFYYSLDENIFFVEKLIVGARGIARKNIDAKLLDAILFNLHLILGVSYWKTYCPKEIIIKSGKLNKAQAEFWNKLYIKGLGEFFYKNKINFKGLARFPYVNNKSASVKFKARNRSLVPFGGGKDSIVTAELLKSNKKDFSLFSLNNSSIQRKTAKILGKKVIVVRRKLDEKLFKMNKAGVYNGHIPITAVYSFVSLLVAALYDYKYIIFSNEESANYGNVEYLNNIINHQYSKSFEFELDFYNYFKKHVSPSFEYFSLLRPLSEFKIVLIFSGYKKYFNYFSSCNKNFKIKKKGGKKWCGACPKCAFAFSQLAVFIPKKILVKIFGKNLYQDKKLLNLFLELWGKKKIKPFDCVGTGEEAVLAACAVFNTKEYGDDFVIKYFGKNILPQEKNIEKRLKKLLNKNRRHNIPKKFRNLI